jgi:hypothetical protein
VYKFNQKAGQEAGLRLWIAFTVGFWLAGVRAEVCVLLGAIGGGATWFLVSAPGQTGSAQRSSNDSGSTRSGVSQTRRAISQNWPMAKTAKAARIAQTAPPRRPAQTQALTESNWSEAISAAIYLLRYICCKRLHLPQIVAVADFLKFGLLVEHHRFERLAIGLHLL